MKWVWALLTILLAVTGATGAYRVVETLVTGQPSMARCAFQAGVVIVCLLAAPRTYAKAKAAW